MEEGLGILQESEGQVIFCGTATIEMNREATHNASKIWLPKQDPNKDNSSDILSQKGKISWSSTHGTPLPPPTRPKLAMVLPLWEVAGVDDLVRVHIPLLLHKYFQTEKSPVLLILPLLKNSSILSNLTITSSMMFT